MQEEISKQKVLQSAQSVNSLQASRIQRSNNDERRKVRELEMMLERRQAELEAEGRRFAT